MATNEWRGDALRRKRQALAVSSHGSRSSTFDTSAPAIFSHLDIWQATTASRGRGNV
jgi:hypothetical protein